MVIDRKLKSIRAFDNQAEGDRLVVNYSSASLSDGVKTWSVVDKFYVFYKNMFFYIKVDDCTLINMDGISTQKIDNTLYKVEKIGGAGQREILFQIKSLQQKFKMLFEHRNKSLRVIENSYLMQNIKGSLFKRNIVELDSLEYIEKI
jgi:hypothetical protein